MHGRTKSIRTIPFAEAVPISERSRRPSDQLEGDMVPIPDMIPVDSTTLEKVGYDAENRELYLQFIGGSTYVYSDVSSETHQDLLGAESLGSYVNRQIKPNYAYRQV